MLPRVQHPWSSVSLLVACCLHGLCIVGAGTKRWEKMVVVQETCSCLSIGCLKPLPWLPSPSKTRRLQYGLSSRHYYIPTVLLYGQYLNANKRRDMQLIVRSLLYCTYGQQLAPSLVNFSHPTRKSSPTFKTLQIVLSALRTRDDPTPALRYSQAGNKSLASTVEVEPSRRLLNQISLP